MKKLLILLLLIVPPCHAAGNCTKTVTGPPATWVPGTLGSPDLLVADVNQCVTNAAGGDTISLPSGSATWSTAVTVSGKALKVVGASVCTPSGTPGTSGYTISCTDNTIITTSFVNPSGVFVVTGSTSNFIDVSGITFISNNVTSGKAGISLTGVDGQSPGVRFHHNHLEMPEGSGASGHDDAYVIGVNFNSVLLDHNYFQDTTSVAGTGSGVMAVFGDWSTRGSSDWTAATSLGGNFGIFIESNYYTTSHSNTEGFYDCFQGGKIITRFNTIIGTGIGGNHGFDSGPFRSCVTAEIYGNYISSSTTMSSGQVVSGSRGGTVLFWGNTVTGSIAYSLGAYVQYNRSVGTGSCDSSDATAWPDVGCVGNNGGLNWIPLSTDPTTKNSVSDTLKAGDWTASHSYASHSFISPTTNNAAGFNYWINSGSGCTSSGTRPSFTQTVGATTSDNTCTWTNVGGHQTTTVTTDGFCVVNPDTLAASNSVCSALSGGDTATRFVDANGGSYPFRDQNGVCHNQVPCPNYEWNNSGSQLPSPVIAAQEPATSNVIFANRDYYNSQTSGCTTTQTTGTCVGTFANLPTSCTAGPGGNTPGVGYFATDKGSWNISGNGFGNGVLYVCNPTNTYVAYYTPLTYPHPLIGTPSGSVSCIPFPSAFGTIPINTPSSPTVITCTNNSGSTITLTGDSINGTNATDFSGTEGSTSCGSGTITNGNSCTISIVFTPRQPVGTSESAIYNFVYTGASGSPVTTNLSGISGTNAVSNNNVFMATMGDHLTCEAPKVGLTVTCLASDCLCVSQNGAPYVAMIPLPLVLPTSFVTSVNGKTGAVTVTTTVN